MLSIISLTTGLIEGSSPAYQVVIRKADRKLHVYLVKNVSQRLIKTYQIVLGNNPVGHKQKQGDGATPEGDYYITHKNSRSKFYLSLGISYPNIKDADAGLQARLITKAQHKAILSAINRQEKPPQNTKLGGDIFIHGGGTGMLFGKPNDWTLGCIALENADIKELFDLLPVRTPVRIDP